VSSIDYITHEANKLTCAFHTRNPYEICDELGVYIRQKDLGTDIKAFYFYQSRIRNIVLNWRVSAEVQRILIAHELGHDRLHKNIAMLKGFKEFELFDRATPTEYEANLFAAELLIDDGELLELLNDDDRTFFNVASVLYVPPGLLDFKLRVLKNKGYSINAPYMVNGDFLKNDIAGCYDDEKHDI